MYYLKNGLIDDKYINLVSVYLKHIPFISTITEILLPVSYVLYINLKYQYSAQSK